MSTAWWHPRSTGDPSVDRHRINIQIGCVALTIAFATALARGIWLNHGKAPVPEALGELAALAALVLNSVGKWSWAVRFGTYGVLLSAASMVNFAAMPASYRRCRGYTSSNQHGYG